MKKLIAIATLTFAIAACASLRSAKTQRDLTEITCPVICDKAGDVTEEKIVTLCELTEQFADKDKCTAALLPIIEEKGSALCMEKCEAAIQQMIEK